ncbi:MAG: cation transporter [Gemmatimonadota bacterium]|nr:MAG: cation transporter [Gemmatimonadota bacterium]
MKKITLEVEGMSCGGCANAVKSALARVAGVQIAAVSLEEKRATLEVEGCVSSGALLSAVEAAGYQATVAD